MTTLKESRAGSTKQRPCACTSGQPYRDCCAPYHLGEREAPDAVALVRSRYAAFVVHDAKYLLKTLHTGHEDMAKSPEEIVKDLKRSMDSFKYMGLKILDSRERGSSAEVLFLVRIFERGQDRSFVELSDLMHDGKGWRYLNGMLRSVSKLKVKPEELTLDGFLALMLENEA